MDRRTFNKFREIVYSKSGIHLKDGKEAMVIARVSKRMRALGISKHREYLKLVLQDNSGEEVVHLLDAISTNVTSFFREPSHFDFIAKVFSDWLREGQRRFRMWSAACSSGEEPYTLAMTLLEASKGCPMDVRILATDISTKALGKCIAGVYPAEKMKNVPKYLRARYFEKRTADDEVFYSARSELKRMLVSRRLNLAATPFPMRGPLDVVFCRNVMIYFDNPVRIKLLQEIHRLLKPGGFLMVGHAESLTGMVSDFRIVQPSIYVK